jgi:lipopolysaccharide/colanic/teichoic acid biosynthesis glycosyltransferase
MVGTGRRVFDFIVAAMALILVAPLTLIIAIAIYAESGRPVIFSQVRLGQHGRPFRLHKIRKFYHIMLPTGDPQRPPKDRAVTLRDDVRMTRVGSLLARTKLDELPQFWNVMIGNMSIVGPRPESLTFAGCFDGRYRAVLDHRPGIFGPNQVFFRSEWCLYTPEVDPEAFYRTVLFPLKARVDLAYFPRRTMRRDFVWIVRGLCAVLGFQFPRDQQAGLVAAVEAWIRQNA